MHSRRAWGGEEA
ncbi:hypothetical protein Pint_07475 [Pistacia integerrima]|uniref:Uncharacterized protein n=1 Tax=Pistacia integerrima TaxID=434235 RepID=A0ACC0XXJ2_9ROSI|nr:hypothetical protein Pint_07475 [Pistacia integerrima]